MAPPTPSTTVTPSPPALARTHAQEIQDLKAKLADISKAFNDLTSTIQTRISSLEKKVG